MRVRASSTLSRKLPRLTTPWSTSVHDALWMVSFAPTECPRRFLFYPKMQVRISYLIGPRSGRHFGRHMRVKRVTPKVDGALFQVTGVRRSTPGSSLTPHPVTDRFSSKVSWTNLVDKDTTLQRRPGAASLAALRDAERRIG